MEPLSNMGNVTIPKKELTELAKKPVSGYAICSMGESPEYNDGKNARANGRPVSDCPHETGSPAYARWVSGWQG